MTKLEALLQKAEDERIEVKEDPLIPEPFKGLYLFDGEPLIVLKAHLDEREKLCILAEEVGHYETATVDLRTCSPYALARQEQLALTRAIEYLVPFESLSRAVHSFIWTRWACAEYLGVTEEFIQKALEYYQQKQPKQLAKLKGFARRNSYP